MKKLLALVLALVMTLSLCVVSSNAAYTDKADIDLKEAVDVLTAVGVFQGSDGKFDPKANLTREQAAKLVAYLQIGQKAADALVGGSKFTDVAKDRWSAGYVDYCASIGIAAGVGDGKFDPTGSLTALQFGKMLLVCLGYDAKVEGMVGADWQINTSKLMTSAKLLRGLSAVTANSVVTREQAAQMMLNALRAPMVEYDTKGTTIAVNGATIEFGASTAEYVTATVAEDSSVKNIGQGTLTNTGNYTVELGEKLYSNLKRTTLADGDDFGRPAHQWTLKATKIGTYSDTPDLSYTASTKLGTIYADLGLGKKIAAEDVTVYVDGVEDATLEKAITKGDTTNKLGGNGTLLEVFFDDDAHSVVITLINTYVGDIVKTVAATAKKDTYVVVETYGVAPTGAARTEEFETEVAFEDDAVVYYTFSVKEDKVESVALCEKVEGTVSQVINKTNDKDLNNGLTIDGTAYKTAAKNCGVKLGEVSVKNDYIAYLDAYGYVIYVEEAKFVSSNYALVLAVANTDVSTFVKKQAKLLFTDGTVEIVDTAKDYYDDINAYDIVTFKVDDAGKYTLKAVDTTLNNSGDTDHFAMTNGKATITVKNFGPNRTVSANSNTAFVVFYDDADDNTVYTGIKNAPTIKAGYGENNDVAVYYFCKSAGMATVMFIAPDSAVNVEDATLKTLYLANESKSNLVHDADGDYFEYNAIANGEITTVKVDATASTKVLNKTYTVDNYNVITKTTAFNNYNGWNDGSKAAILGAAGISKTSAEYTVTIGSGYNAYTLTVADDAKIYYTDSDGEIEESSYGKIAPDENDLVYAVIDDNQVIFLVIEEDGVPERASYHRVNFTGNHYTATKANGGSMNNSDRWVLDGSNFSFKLTPSSNYAVKSVKVAGVELTANASGVYTLTNVTEDVTVAVETAAAYTLTFKTADAYSAMVSINGGEFKQITNTSTNVTYTAAANEDVTVEVLAPTDKTVDDVTANNGNFVYGGDYDIFHVVAAATGNVVITLANK